MAQTSDAAETVNYKEAAQLLNTGLPQLYIMVNRGHFNPIKIAGQREKLILRAEIENYIASREWNRISQARQWVSESVNLLLEAMLWGVSDDGAPGVEMRQRVLEQVGRLRLSEAGREALTTMAEGLKEALATEPLKSAASARVERERMRQLHDTISAALASPLEGAPTGLRRPPTKKPRTPKAPAPKRPRLTATPK